MIQLIHMQAPEKKILKTAVRFFKAFGYSKTSLNEIAASVGVSKKTIYKYYQNKNGLFLAVVSHMAYDYRQQFVRDTEGFSIQEKVLYLLKMNIKKHIKVTRSDAGCLSPEIEDMMRQTAYDHLAPVIRSLIAEGIAGGELVPYSADFYQNMFSILFDGMIQKIKKREMPLCNIQEDFVVFITNAFFIQKNTKPSYHHREGKNVSYERESKTNRKKSAVCV